MALVSVKLSFVLIVNICSLRRTFQSIVLHLVLLECACFIRIEACFSGSHHIIHSLHFSTDVSSIRYIHLGGERQHGVVSCVGKQHDSTFR